MGKAVEALKHLPDSGLLREITESVKKRSLPNIVRVFPRVLRVESLHSDVLRWLLDPRGWYGLGDRFAGELLRRALGPRCEGADKDHLSARAEMVVDEVHTEIPVGGEIIDIVVLGRWGDRSFVFGVENKIDAPEGRKWIGEEEVWQLRSQAEALCGFCPEPAVFVALLAPHGCRPGQMPAEVRWASLSDEDAAVPLDTARRSQSASIFPLTPPLDVRWQASTFLLSGVM
jgi:hypothetical protein